MRKTLTLLAAIVLTSTAWAQTSQLVSPEQSQPLRPLERALPTEISSMPDVTAPANDDPIGTIVTDAVTAIKIGSASNAFTYLLRENVNVSALQASDGDAISFIYRQNIADCGGATIDNGLYRYSISTDGGTNWNVGAAGTSNASTIPTGCYGLGPINATYTQVSRYPNMLLTQPAGGTTVADIKAVYTGPVLDPGYPTVEGWDGAITGLIDDAASGSWSSAQEDYLFQNNDQYFSYSLTERVPGEYFYTAWNYNGVGATNEIGTTLKVNKGVYNASTGKVDWSNVLSYQMPFVKFMGTTDSTDARAGAPNIAFSPDGMTGYVSFNADVFDRDSAFLPVFMKTTNGGLTWSDPYEVELIKFGGLRELLQSFWIVVDTVSGDTLPAGSGLPTTVFDHALTVDANGNPHFITVVANATRNNADGSQSEATYSVFSGFRMFLCDVTIDSYGDPNVIVLSPQVTFRGSFGLIGAGGSDETTADPWLQVSRTADGSKIFVSTTDSDTTGNFGDSDNSNPNFITRAIDVNTMKMTTLTNWTGNDLTWTSRAVMPKTSPIALEDGSGNYTLPTVVMDFVPNTSLTLPVQFWYFSDIAFNDADFTEDVEFFYNCKENPFTNTTSETTPGCGLSDGAITVNAAGGLGSTYTYEWSANAGGATTASVSGLAAGIYTVTVTDSVGCSDEIEVILNNANAPTVVVDSTANIECFGDGNGYAGVTATPAGGATISSYMWSNGETTAIATMLPSGQNTLTVTDDQNCVSTVTVNISEPSAISLDASASGASCFGDATGAASAVAFGGTGNLSFSWSNGATTPSITGVVADSYTVTVTDENGCNTNTTVAVTQPDSLALTLTQSPNNATNPPYVGFANVEHAGGTDPVTYQWTGPAGFSDNKKLIFSLPGGMYVCTATDANGCVTVDSVLVEGPGPAGDAIEDELNAGISTMSIFPNPNNGVFSINMELDRAEDVTIEVLNLNGQVVEAVRERNALVVDRTFNLSNIPSGVYLIQVTTSRGTAGRKVVLR